jgi:hypothetical protein
MQFFANLKKRVTSLLSTTDAQRHTPYDVDLQRRLQALTTSLQRNAKKNRGAGWSATGRLGSVELGLRLVVVACGVCACVRAVCCCNALVPLLEHFLSCSLNGARAEANTLLADLLKPLNELVWDGLTAQGRLLLLQLAELLLTAVSAISQAERSVPVMVVSSNAAHEKLFASLSPGLITTKLST